MNTILCDKCGATIPLRTVDQGDDALPRSSYSCQICDPPKKAMGKKSGCGIFGHILGLLLFAFCGIGLQKCSFSKVAEIRQLARVPETDVLAAVPGEINLRGAAQATEGAEGRIKSPDTKSPCFYFRYHVERRERDSEGKTKWVTVSNKSKYVPEFMLRDKTGVIPIRPNNRVDFNVPQSHQRRSGDMRYTEYRLDPGEAVFIFGYAEPEGLAETSSNASGLFVGFDRVGDYQPLISKKTELKERTGRATSAIIACWAGLCLIGVATVIVFSLTGSHRLLVYFWILSTAVGLVLVFLGIAMMRSDLKAAHEHVVRQADTVQTVIAGALENAQIPWDEEWSSLGSINELAVLTDQQKERLKRVRIDLAIAARRVGTQAKKFPYSLLAPSLKLTPLPEVPLPAVDEELLTRLESKFQKAKLSGFASWLWGIIGFVGAILATLFGFRSVRQKRMTENLSTSSTVGVAYGLTELKGIVDLPEGIDPLQGPLSRKPCVTYDYRIQERRGSGKKAKWVEIHRDERNCPFVCRDRDGTFPIDPEGAQIMTWRKDTRREGRLRHIENRLQFGDPLYAIGSATVNPETGDSLYLRKPEQKDEPFVLASFTEEAVVAKRGIRAIGWMTGAFGLILLSGLMLFASGGAFSPADFLAAALVGPAYLVVLTLILHYNDLVFLRQRARRNWANIEVSIKKRHDLMPAMIEVAKSFMSHESELQTRLANLRDSYGGGVALNPALAENLLQEGHLLGGMIVGQVEKYPDLLGSKQTSLVIRQLVALEDEIALMRAGYNDAVTQYNTRISVFPDVLLAKIGRFTPMNILNYDAEVIPMPEIAQETWRRQQAADTATQDTAKDEWTISPLPVPDPDSPVTDAVQVRAFLYASLLDEIGTMRVSQLELIDKEEGHAMADAVQELIESTQKLDSWSLISQTRQRMSELREMSAETFLHFKAVARLLIEADDWISTYEYAFQKAMAFLVDPVFATFEEPAILHKTIDSVKEDVEVLHSHLSDPSKEDNLGAFDAAIGEIFQASGSVRMEVYKSCYEAFVNSGGEQDTSRFILIQSLADGLFYAP